MCNVITFRFTCHHTLSHRRSNCAGTKHKVTATSIRAACIAQSFLELHLRTACGPCQHAAWDAAWKLKLGKSNAFLEKLRQQDFPGVREVEKLVQELRREYVEEEWKCRNVFAQIMKGSVARVKHTYYVKAASKLPQEVRPEDVVETTAKEWVDMDIRNYDGNYVASTDPIHPVSTNYAHPREEEEEKEEDAEWIERFLEEGEGGGGEDEVGFDSGGEWDWDGGGDARESNADTASITWDSEVLTTIHDYDDDAGRRSNTSPSAALEPLTDNPHLTSEQSEHTAQINQVVQAFWSLLATTNPPPPAPSDTNSLTNLLFDLTITPHTPNTTPSPSSLWTDGPSDILLHPPPLRRPSTPSSPKSTRAWYDKQRAILKPRKDVDLGKYYRDWLYILRCEVRDFSGTEEGCVIGEPRDEDSLRELELGY